MKIFISVFRSGGFLTLLILLSNHCTFAQSDSLLLVKEIELVRLKQETEFRDPTASPLSPKDRKKFKHLNYYPIDLRYHVRGRFVKTENPVFFKMKTTTERLRDYFKYGEIYFFLDTLEYKLEVYQSPDVTKQPGYEDYLLIPFTDLTNGEETYEVGRYLEFRIPTTDEVVIDFNKAYNPYCSYGTGKYSCPIPPEANQLPIAIRAGEKKFKVH
jgi:uncharacterized protein